MAFDQKLLADMAAADARSKSAPMVTNELHQLSDKLAVGADELQWILMRSSQNRATGAVHWQPFAYISSTRDILVRVIRESGLDKDGAAAAKAVESMPPSFKASKAAQYANGRIEAPQRNGRPLDGLDSDNG